MSKTDLFYHIRTNNCLNPNFIYLSTSDKQEYKKMHKVELDMQVTVWKCTKCLGFYYET